MQARGCSSHRAERGVEALLGLVFVLIGGRVAWAQWNPTPSSNSPSSMLERNFGRLGGRLGSSGASTPAFTMGRDPAGVASVSGGSVSRNWGRGRPRAPRMGGASSRGGRGQLLGRRSGYGSQLPAGGFGARPRRGTFLNQVGAATFQGVTPRMALYPYRRELGKVSTRYASWGAPELVAKRSNPKSQITLSQENGNISIPAPRVTLQERVKNRLSGRRQVYEVRAMEAFKAGRYQEACSQLKLAGATIVDESEKQLYLKLVFMYASIASQQFAEALNALVWVLGEDPTTGGLRNPQVLNRVRDVRSFYGQPDDYIAHNRRLESFIDQQAEVPAAMALRAMMAWGRKDAADATFLARQLAHASGPESPWSRLYEMIQQAQQGSGAKNAERVREPVPAGSPPLEFGESLPE